MRNYITLTTIFIFSLATDIRALETPYTQTSSTFGTGKPFTLKLGRDTFEGLPETRDCNKYPEICFRVADGRIALESGVLLSDGATDRIQYRIAIFDSSITGHRIIYGGIWFNRKRVSLLGSIKEGKSKFKAVMLDQEYPSDYSCLSDEEEFSRDLAPRSSQKDQVATQDLDDRPIISVLTAYTPEVKSKLGGAKQAVYAMVAFKFYELAEAMKNSNIDIKFKIAGAPHALRKSDTIGAAGAGVALINGDGIYDELHSLRKSRKADIVHIFNTGTSGAGFIPRLPLSDDPLPGLGRHAFSSSVVGEYYFYGSTIFQHEIGHNLGAGHHVDTTPEGYDPNLLGFEPSAHGYRFTGMSGEKYITIMTYDNPEEIQLNYYSSPEILYDGVPIGDETADNSSTIKYVANLVQQYSENIEYPKNQKLKVHLSRNAEDPDTYFNVLREGPNQLVLQKERIQVASFFNSKPSVGWESEYGESSFNVPLDGSGRHFARLYPDIYVDSKVIKVPNLYAASISAFKDGLHIFGKVYSGSKLVKELPGFWLTLAKQNIDTGEYESIGSIHLNSSGEYKTKSLDSGMYRVQFPVRSPFDKSQIITKYSDPIIIP